MLPDEDQPEPPYNGPLVILRPDGVNYTVSIEPSLPTGDGQPRTYGSKNDAWSAARALWTDHKLPLRDLTDGYVAAHYLEK